MSLGKNFTGKNVTTENEGQEKLSQLIICTGNDRSWSSIDKQCTNTKSQKRLLQFYIIPYQLFLMLKPPPQDSQEQSYFL